jgi:glycosyltransferase involved in cell wall biosynthesis
MNILFITAHKYLPQMYGGLQTSTDELCKGFLTKGHRVSVLAGLMPDGWIGYTSRLQMRLRKHLTGHKIAKDTSLGYSVWRSWFPWEHVALAVRKERPDLIVVLAINPVRMALAARPTGVPIVMRLMDVEFKAHGGPFEELGNIVCIANSKFTADTYRRAYGVESVVLYPFMDPKKYETTTTRENVTFINPVPKKGLDIAVAVARLCPDIPFSFIEGWPLSQEQRQKLMHKLAPLSNVTLLAPHKDMRQVYGKCKILLVPSQWEEGYGRVATEAQFSGIPVVASNRGGLPEAVGLGGRIVDPDSPIEHWVSCVRELWHNDALYRDLATAATVHAHRSELSSFLLDKMEQCFLAHCNSHSDNSRE